MFGKSKIFFALAFIFTLIFSASALKCAEATTRAAFSNTNAFCEVRISDALMNKRGYHYATVKLITRGSLNVKTNGKVQITMTDENGNHIWSGVKNGGVTLKLGNDHRVYRIYVRTYSDGSSINGIGGNATKCQTWEFTNAKDCEIS